MWAAFVTVALLLLLSLHDSPRAGLVSATTVSALYDLFPFSSGTKSARAGLELLAFRRLVTCVSYHLYVILAFGMEESVKAKLVFRWDYRNDSDKIKKMMRLRIFFPHFLSANFSGLIVVIRVYLSGGVSLESQIIHSLSCSLVYLYPE